MQRARGSDVGHGRVSRPLVCLFVCLFAFWLFVCLFPAQTTALENHGGARAALEPVWNDAMDLQERPLAPLLHHAALHHAALHHAALQPDATQRTASRLRTLESEPVSARGRLGAGG